MAARSGMATLIADARLLADAGTAEHSVDGVTYYDDDAVQRILDQHRMDVTRERMAFEAQYNAGSAEYYDYYWALPHVEEAASGTTAWVITDGNGSAIGTADYTVNYDAQQVRFDSNTTGSVFYLTYHSYDLDMAVSRLWRDKASHVADRFDVKTDNHDLKRSQLAARYMEKAQEYAGKARPKHVRMVRVDLNV